MHTAPRPYKAMRMCVTQDAFKKLGGIAVYAECHVSLWKLILTKVIANTHSANDGVRLTNGWLV